MKLIIGYIILVRRGWPGKGPVLNSADGEERHMVRYRKAQAHGINIFYREAGSARAPGALLLPGFPTSSHMFRDLIPLLAERYHVVAPDLPGFGFTEGPDRKK